MFILRRQREITPRQLVQKQEAGCAVYRSAHIGNQYLSNLLVASLGLPLYLYDRTLSGKDRNYHPGLIIKGGEKVRILDPEECREAGIIVPYGTSDGDSPHDDTPASFHYRTLQELFPGLVMTESEALLRQEEKLSQVLEVVGRNMPTAIDRYIFPCGCMAEFQWQKEHDTHRRLARCWHNSISASPEELGQLTMRLMHELRGLVLNPSQTVRQGGATPKLELFVILSALVAFWETGQQEMFELSGPDMIHYAFKTQFLDTIERIWDRIVEHAPKDAEIPSMFTMNIVPTAEFRFGHLEGDSAGKELIELCLKATAAPAKKKLKQLSRAEAIAAIASTNGDLARIRDLLERWDILYDIHRDSFFSHHDLLASGRRLVVPEEFLDMSFSEIGQKIHKLRSLLR